MSKEYVEIIGMNDNDDSVTHLICHNQYGKYRISKSDADKNIFHFCENFIEPMLNIMGYGKNSIDEVFGRLPQTTHYFPADEYLMKKRQI